MGTEQADHPVLLCWDGSERAETAIRQAGRLVTSRRGATVLHVWQPTERSLGPLEALRGRKRSDAPVSSRSDAEEQVARGVIVAREAGFDAEPLLLEAESSTAEMISSVAERREAALVVVGSRGLRGMSARAAGSVSRRLLETVDRPKLVV